jgi:hypothetical protein
MSKGHHIYIQNVEANCFNAKPDHVMFWMINTENVDFA